MRTFVSSLTLAGTLLAVNAHAQQPCELQVWHLNNLRAIPVAQFLQPPRSDSGGYLGVRLADIDADRAKVLKLGEPRGVEIKIVMEGSPADNAGIRPGDVLLTYNGEALLGAQQLSRLVQETPPGRTVKVQYWRDGKTQMTSVVIGEAPSSNPGPNLFLGFPGSNWPNPSINVPSPFMVWRNSALGVEFERVDYQLAEYFGVKGGALVRSVQHGSPAEKAGLKAGDVIYSVNQQPLVGEHDFSSLLRQPGETVAVSLMRDHKRVDMTINVP
ncbi:MAG TPA: PDZ domain-containing protein [Bryobacteraceae bacterium]|nr:PDZ domain-containing protein [Bryobacteraceae bacterium]